MMFIDIMTHARQRPAAGQRRLQLPGRCAQRAQRVHADEAGRAAAAVRVRPVGHDQAEQDVVLDQRRRRVRSTRRRTCWPCCPTARRPTDTIRQPRDSFNLNVPAGPRDQQGPRAARSASIATRRESRNLGVGGYNLFDRAYDSDSSNTMLRLSENGPLGRRMFTESRLQLRWADTESQSVVEAPTMRVNDAFTSGGAQQRGGQRSFAFELATDLDYVRGAHSWRTGVLRRGRALPLRRHDELPRAPSRSPAWPTTRRGRPSNYSRRIGDPTLRFSTFQARPLRAGRLPRLAQPAGVGRRPLRRAEPRERRLEPVAARHGRVVAASERHAHDARRATGTSTTGSPATSTSRRCSSTGSRQRELNIRDPSYPDPGDGRRDAADQPVPVVGRPRAARRPIG